MVYLVPVEFPQKDSTLTPLVAFVTDTYLLWQGVMYIAVYIELASCSSEREVCWAVCVAIGHNRGQISFDQNSSLSCCQLAQAWTSNWKHHYATVQCKELPTYHLKVLSRKQNAKLFHSLEV